MSQDSGPITKEVVQPLYMEDLSITRRTTERGAVRVNVQTHTHEQLIDENLLHEQVNIQRIPIGRPVEAAPPVREEGDTIIIPVVERPWW
jgi:stress response protein YsnF